MQKITLAILILAVMSLTTNCYAKEPTWRQMIEQADLRLSQAEKKLNVIYNLVNALAVKKLGQTEYNRIIHRLMEEEAEGE